MYSHRGREQFNGEPMVTIALEFLPPSLFVPAPKLFCFQNISYPALNTYSYLLYVQYNLQLKQFLDIANVKTYFL